MTRTEEIEKKAHSVSYNTDEYESFIFGAEWADETMIKKACEWLIRGGYFVNKTETIEDFCKAMEE